MTFTETPDGDVHGGFGDEFKQCTQRLRGALTELFASLDADPESPQEVSRKIGINRNVAWKLTRIIKSSDPYRTFQLLPGTSGMKIVLEAFQTSGSPVATIEAVRAAWAQYEQMVERHAGDRPTFEMMLSSMHPELDEGQALRASRKAAFMGNSAVWGAQARVLFVTHVVAPSLSQPEFLDQAMVGGLIDLRRFRPTVRWVLGRKVFEENVPGDQDSAEEPIDPGEEEGCGLSLLRDFSTSPLPEIRAFSEPRAVRYELMEGPVGNSGSCTCIFGWIRRRFSTVAGSAADDHGEHFLRMGTPAEVAQVDLLVHEDLPFTDPAPYLFDLMHGEMIQPLAEQTAFHLPAAEQIEDLGKGPPVLSTAHIHRYPQMVRLATERLGHDLERSRGYRLTIAYPAMSTMAVMSYRKPRA